MMRRVFLQPSQLIKKTRKVAILWHECTYYVDFFLLIILYIIMTKNWIIKNILCRQILNCLTFQSDVQLTHVSDSMSFNLTFISYFNDFFYNSTENTQFLLTFRRFVFILYTYKNLDNFWNKKYIYIYLISGSECI